jgi:hypothetical protein
LRRLRENSNIRAQIPGVEDVIREALSANEAIASKGLLDYYGRESKPAGQTTPKLRTSKRPSL